MSWRGAVLPRVEVVHDDCSDFGAGGGALRVEGAVGYATQSSVKICIILVVIASEMMRGELFLLFYCGALVIMLDI
jgi:hypothetical protein